MKLRKSFSYLGDTVGARGGAFDSVKTRVKNGWCKFRDLKMVSAKTVRWMCSVRPEDRIPAEELSTRLKLKSMRKYTIED